MMKKRLWASLLAISLLLALISGCGGTSSSAASAPADESEAAVSAAEEPAEEAEAAPEAEGAEEAVAPEDIEYQAPMTEETAAIIAAAAEEAGAVPAEQVPEDEKNDQWKFIESEEFSTALAEMRQGVDAVFPTSEKSYDAEGNLLSCKGVPYSYPLEDGHSISAYAVTRGLVSNYVGDYSELITFQIAGAETNIDVDWFTVSGDASATQMSLIFASGDYPDIVSDFSYSYSGTVADAYDNDLIVPLNDYLEDYSPNYKAWIDSSEAFAKSVTADDGNIYSWYCLQPEVTQEQSGWVRADLLESYGLDKPVTMDEYEEYFELCKNDGLSSVISAGCYSFAGIAASAYDLPNLSSTDGFSAGLYHVGDEIKSAFLTDECKEYLKKMNEWYNKGYFSNDIVSLNGSQSAISAIDQLIYNGEVGYMVCGSGHYSNYVSSAAVEGWDITPVQNIVLNEGDSTHFSATYSISGNCGSIVLSSNCSDIEAACRYVDWFYTDMGINELNYGPEGVTWNWSEDGTTRLFTAALYDNPVYDLPAAAVSMLYTGGVAWVTIGDCYMNMYYATSQIAIDAQEIWSINNDSDYYLDETVLSFDVDESETINSDLSTIDTYLAENVVKFLIGELDIDSEWDEFVDNLKSMGLQEVVDTYQAAYDRYLAR